MEVPENILVKLKCENCEEYLSQGPILLLDTGKSLCGRCVGPAKGATRNTPYEEVAKLLKFPCKYAEDGCQEKVTIHESKLHEAGCKYRQQVCPITVHGTCEWTGLIDGPLNHCQTAHRTKVKQNSFKFSLDITRTNLNNFLLTGLNVLFLLQTKICCTTRSIYYCVRLIGDPRCATKYEYDIVFENNGSKVTKHAVVMPQGGLALQEDVSVRMTFDGLFAILGHMQGATCTVTVGTNDEAINNTQVYCVKCQNPTKPVYKENTADWYCQNCVPPQRLCSLVYKGCPYKDFDMKCMKHESYFCKCHITVLNNISLFNCQQEGYVWTVTPVNKWNVHIINCHFGRTVCFFERRDNNFIIHLRTTLHSKDLYLYKCTVEICHPVKKETCYTYTPEARYETMDDWTVELSVDDLKSYTHNETFNININFNKSPDPNSCIIS